MGTKMKAVIALCLLAVVAAEPWGYFGVRGGFRGRSIGFGGQIGKREAEADPISFGYRGRYSGRYYGIRLPRFGKREAEAEPLGFGVRIPTFRGRSFGFRGRLGKREAEPEPLNIGYRGRYSGRFYGVRLGKREAEPYGYYGARVGFRGRSFGFGGRFGKREAEADPISFGYRGRSGRFYGVGYRGRSGRFYGVRLGKREAQP